MHCNTAKYPFVTYHISCVRKVVFWQFQELYNILASTIDLATYSALTSQFPICLATLSNNLAAKFIQAQIEVLLSL